MNEPTQPKELTATQARALEALLTSPTIEKAAQATGVDKTTLHRWMKQPDFAQAFRAAKESLVESALTGLQAISGEAVEALHNELSNPLAKPSERISAARAILEYALRHREEVEIDKRINAIEEALSTLNEVRK